MERWPCLPSYLKDNLDLSGIRVSLEGILQGRHTYVDLIEFQLQSVRIATVLYRIASIKTANDTVSWFLAHLSLCSQDPGISMTLVVLLGDN